MISPTEVSGYVGAREDPPRENLSHSLEYAPRHDLPSQSRLDVGELPQIRYEEVEGVVDTLLTKACDLYVGYRFDEDPLNGACRLE